MTARVKAEAERVARFRDFYEPARADALREAEALVELLRSDRATLRQIHDAAQATNSVTGMLMTHSAWLAEARKNHSLAKAGKPRLRRKDSLVETLGWPAPWAEEKKAKVGAALRAAHARATI